MFLERYKEGTKWVHVTISIFKIDSLPDKSYEQIIRIIEQHIRRISYFLINIIGMVQAVGKGRFHTYTYMYIILT